MDIGIKNRIFLGMGANFYGQLVTVAVQLAGVPILIHYWGVQLYGEWLILFAIPAYLSISDLGISQAAANDMTARAANEDKSGANKVFQSIALLIFGIIVIGLIITSIIIPYLPLHSWMNFKSLDESTTRLILWLLVAQVFANLVDGINHAGFRASGKYALHRLLNSNIRLLQFSGLWIGAILGLGPIIATFLFFVIRLIGTVGNSFILLYRHPWLKLRFNRFDHGGMEKLIKPSLANICIPLAEVLNIHGLTLIIGAFLGPIAVVTFSTLRTLTRLVYQLALAIINAVEPELARTFGVSDIAQMRNLFIHCMRGALWLAIVIAIGLAIFGNSILKIWTHGNVSMDLILFIWLLASAVTNVFWYGSITVMKAANRHVRVAIFYLFISIINLVSSGFLIFITKQITLIAMMLFLMDLVLAIFIFKGGVVLLKDRMLLILNSILNPMPLLSKNYRKKLLNKWL